MQYQVFVKNPAKSEFMASVIGLPNLTANGITEKEAITYGRLLRRQTLCERQRAIIPTGYKDTPQ